MSALSFLGMAAGPFVGASILEAFSASSGLPGPPWRWVFYLSAPFALLAAVYVWAAGRGWPRAASTGGLDVVGGGIFTGGVALGLLAISTLGASDVVDPLISGATAAVLIVIALLIFARSRDPFIDLRHFRDRTFSGAVAMSLLTGYGLATAIIGAAVFVDRVRYAGAAEQQVALGALAGAMAIGALSSGYLVRPLGVMVPSLAGLLAEIAGLLIVAGATPATDLGVLAGGAGSVRPGFRCDRHGTHDRRARGTRSAGFRGGLGGADRGAHDRHGCRTGGAHRVRVQSHRGAQFGAHRSCRA